VAVAPRQAARVPVAEWAEAQAALAAEWAARVETPADRVETLADQADLEVPAVGAPEARADPVEARVEAQADQADLVDLAEAQVVRADPARISSRSTTKKGTPYGVPFIYHYRSRTK
jgi:hypothetical protein